MKFGHAYKEFLVEGGFPAEWVNSAISYQKLKKCIKQVRLELASLGLNPETLQLLLSGAEEDRKAADEADEDDRALRYEFEDGNSKAAKSGAIKPKLLFLVDEATGEPIDARLSPETKSYIHQLALNQKLTNVRISDHDDTESLAATDSRRSSDFDLADDHSSRRVSKPHRLIEIPLTSDSDFFNLLQNELSGLAHLQKTERMKLHDEIAVVGNALVKAADPNSKRGKADLDKWRRLFELYIESRIFFSTAEQSHGLQTYTAAQERYSKFLTKATEVGLLGKYKMRESGDALKGFLSINGELLMNLRFHEINQIAMNKILKSQSFQYSAAISNTNEFTRVRQTDSPRCSVSFSHHSSLPNPAFKGPLAGGVSTNHYLNSCHYPITRRLSLPDLL